MSENTPEKSTTSTEVTADNERSTATEAHITGKGAMETETASSPDSDEGAEGKPLLTSSQQDG